MELPVFFELDGDFAAMLPAADGGLIELKSPGSPSIADFMETGSVIELKDLPEDLRADVEEEFAGESAKHLMSLLSTKGKTPKQIHQEMAQAIKRYEQAKLQPMSAAVEKERDVFFELDGDFAAILPSEDGGAAIVKSPGSPNIADFMATGSVLELKDLPEGFRKSVDEVLAIQSARLVD